VKIDNEIIIYGLTIFLFLLISAFFSAAETALTAISRARIYQLVMDGNKRAQIVSRLRREKESLIGTVLLGNNAANIAASAMATTLSIKLFGDGGGLVIVTIIMTLMVVVFCEVLPKTYAIQNAETVSLKLSPLLSLTVRLLFPITWSIQIFIRGLLGLFGIDISKANTLISATDVIRGTIELHHREGSMIKQDRDMLGSILDLNDIEVKEIMIHRTQVETINADQPADALVAQAVSTMHSRIPLWRDEPDNIIGVLHVKNLIKALGEHGGKITSEGILAICSKPWFIPDTISLRDQLLAFRNKRQHFAFVVNEYGGWQGIVTLEDIIEEIVGDIDDEHDDGGSDIHKIGDNIYHVAGGVSLRDLNRQLDWNLPDGHAATVAGLLIHAAETIPSVGEYFDIHGFRFTVVARDALQITHLRIEKLPDTMLPEDVEV
jgi:Mg2+/Co2+ transporter CorB